MPENEKKVAWVEIIPTELKLGDRAKAVNLYYDMTVEGTVTNTDDSATVKKLNEYGSSPVDTRMGFIWIGYRMFSYDDNKWFKEVEVEVS